MFGIGTSVFAACAGPCNDADCNNDGTCDMDEDCMSCTDCLPLAPGGCECCNPWSALSDPITKCIPHTVANPCPAGLETCFHPDHLCTVIGESCLPNLPTFPFLICVLAPVCGNHN